ncbi:MAG: helix-turn-helix transcriptional regulator [Spirochaetales bacterium]|nr:helix-turn-helix transcriptional regulator [Spirochaetales bacterium]
MVGILFSLILLYILMKKPSWLLFYFLCFFIISIYHQAGIFFTSRIIKTSQSLDIHQFWRVSLAFSRLRYIFLILFVHASHRFKATRVLTIFFVLLIGAGIILPFYIYSIIPNLMEITVVLYSFIYWLFVYMKKERISLSDERLRLLRAVLLCSGFFLTGIILDLLESIPQASVYISILLIDFYPVYLICIGGVITFWAVRDLYFPIIFEESKRAQKLDFSGLPVTKREREIIGLIIKGKTNTNISDQLFISESTVKKHINNLFRKLEISSRWELIKLTDRIHPKE